MLKKYNEFLIKEFKVGSIDIADMNIYLDGMANSLNDKLYFLNMIKLDLLIDFGSADGTLLNYISMISPEIKLIGYDIDEKMIEISKSKFSKIQFESEWNVIEKTIKENKNEKIGLLLSSVIHEVYSYFGSKIINNFWNKQVFNDNIDYVIIRDMVPSSKFNKMNITDIEKIRKKSNAKQLEEFEDIWGSINDNFRIALHWLLKYRYINNWKRELYENYVPVTIEHLKEKWIPSNWKIIYENHYTLDFIKKQVKKDFDITLTEPTHLKMIIKNDLK